MIQKIGKPSTKMIEPNKAGFGSVNSTFSETLSKKITKMAGTIGYKGT